MTKGLRVLSWMYPISKLIKWNYRKATVNGYTFNYWWTNFHFINRDNFGKAVLNIQIWVGLLHNIMIHKCFFQGLVALNREFNAKILNKKQMERLQERLSHIIPSLILVSFVAWLITHCPLLLIKFILPLLIFICSLSVLLLLLLSLLLLSLQFLLLLSSLILLSYSLNPHSGYVKPDNFLLQFLSQIFAHIFLFTFSFFKSYV